MQFSEVLSSPSHERVSSLFSQRVAKALLDVTKGYHQTAVG